MAIPNNKKELISHAVIKVLYSRFKSFPSDDEQNRNAPFHVAFMQAFEEKLDGRVKNIPDFINLSSWMHGLNTSLGQSFFESVAQILCDGEKRDFKNKKLYHKQIAAIAEIMIDLKNGTHKPSVEREEFIINNNANGEKQDAQNFTADCFYETDVDVVAIELKSVRPNSGEMRGEKEKILKGKAVLKELFPKKNVKYIFGFPFDPTATDNVNYNKKRYLHYLVEAEKFIAEEDFLIADELWSFLANSNNAMQEILEIINSIATPQFMDKFEALQNKTMSEEEKRKLFEEWYLYSELYIMDNIHRTSSNTRLYNQCVFKNDGSYNTRRRELALI
ncbi:MAG: TdeIII family type II restriction endonuclease [Bacteroidaceae bacterium]|nr:TdeIII family type II restriction endonuclease [Bacteroidaceae bacterium]